MKKFVLPLLALLGGLLALCSCDSTTILGSSGEVIVVMDKADWEGELGTEIRLALESPVEFLDPAEKKFKLTFIESGALSRQLRMNRNVVLCLKADSTAVIYRKDVWAHPQIVVQLNAPNSHAMAQLVAANADALYRKIEMAEINRNVEKCYKYEIPEITAQIEKFAGGSPRIPATGYRVGNEADGFIWVNNATQYVTSGVIVIAYPAAGDGEDLNPDRLTARLREKINLNVPGGPEGSYMDISPLVVPIVSDLVVNGRNIKQIRSRWIIEGDSMGGPYVSHSFLTPDGAKVVTEMAFLFCQRYDNRSYFRQVESILYSFKWANEPGAEK